MESPCECDIELPGFISHEVNYLFDVGCNHTKIKEDQFIYIAVNILSVLTKMNQGCEFRINELGPIQLLFDTDEVFYYQQYL